LFRGTAIALVQTLTILNSQEGKARLMASDRAVLTVKEVSELLQIHQSTVYKLIKEGKIPSFRIGSFLRFRTDLIERWMAEKSMYARQVRKVLESGVNGKARHRSLAGSGRT
jgi:excisionase family DNA binding protein